jgi:cell division protein FtsB
MAVYQGARRPAAFPLGIDVLGRDGRGTRKRGSAGSIGTATTRARTTGRATGARRSARAVKSRRRPSSVGIVLTAIVLVFSAAFLSLSQSVRVAATGYDIVRLVSEHDQLQAIRQDLTSDVERLRSEPAIRKEALDGGLGQLGAPLLVPAR